MIETLFPAGVHTGLLTEAVDIALLYPEEAGCVRNAVAARRKEFAQGRLCARRVLAELGISDFPLLAGKDRAPIWPAGIVGSLTHSGGTCAVAIARADRFAGLGIDVETAEPLGEELVELVCLESELAWLRELPEASQGILARLLFSAKESVFKCFYPISGVFLEFHDCEIRIEMAESETAPHPTHSTRAPADGAGKGLDGDRGLFTATLRNRALPEAWREAEHPGRFARSPGRLFTGMAIPKNSLAGLPVRQVSSRF